MGKNKKMKQEAGGSQHSPATVFVSNLPYTFTNSQMPIITRSYLTAAIVTTIGCYLEVIWAYHGHLSGVYCLALHPTIDVLLTGGRDSVCWVWDIRSKMQIHALAGHDNMVCSVFNRPTDPQVITGSHDSTIKFWDLRYGKTMATLTHHKKSVRALAQHPTGDSFASASADNTKKFSLPRGEFLHNMLSQQKTIINAMTVNQEGVLATGGDNGSLWFWDWKSGHSFQQSQTIVQPGSLDSEAGIYALSYDMTGSRLVTCEADKTIKMWKEDENATPETHPVNFKPPKDIHKEDENATPETHPLAPILD